jgi:bacterioferritin-associated ferredoxin
LGSLQKYKLKKVSCEKIEGTIGQSSSDQFFTNLLMQLNKEIDCKNKCGKCLRVGKIRNFPKSKK